MSWAIIVYNNGLPSAPFPCLDFALLPSVIFIHSCCLNIRLMHIKVGFFAQTSRDAFERYLCFRKGEILEPLLFSFFLGGNRRNYIIQDYLRYR